MPKWLEVKYSKYIMTLLPTQLRTDDIFNYVYIPVKLIEPLLKDVKSLWKTYYYRLTNNGQVFSLLRMLNDKYAPVTFKYDEDKGEALIYVSDVTDTADFWISDKTKTPVTEYVSDVSHHVPKVDFTIIGLYDEKKKEEIRDFIRDRIPAGRTFAIRRS